eukprot:scaffold25665_cov135-Isochrysis_galbana.AAC.4
MDFVHYFSPFDRVGGKGAQVLITVWHANGRAVRALERDTTGLALACHRGPEIFTSPGKSHDFRVVPL